MAFMDDVAVLVSAHGNTEEDASAPWRRFDLGVGLPGAFEEFVGTFGPGYLNHQIRFYHPSIRFPHQAGGNQLLGEYVSVELEGWNSLWGVCFDDPPYQAGLGVGDLLPWGDTTDGVGLFFRVGSGDPDLWPVIEYCDGEYEDSGLGFDSWLLRYLNGGGSRGSFVRNDRDMTVGRASYSDGM